MDEVAEQTKAVAMLTELLAEPEGKRIFDEAVASAFDAAHGRTTRCFDIDKLNRLAAGIESYKYASEHMLRAKRFPHRHRLMEFAAKGPLVDGPVLEFGVWTGRSINFIADQLPSRAIYGFDSFEGLPEAWFAAQGKGGTFSVQGALPEVRQNVTLVPGWFDRTLPGFLDANPFDKIALLHVDCDLYSSTQTIFAQLYQRIVPGTVIVFDEYFNYPTWERHEHRAFMEFVAFRQLSFEYIGLVPGDMQVAARILGV